MTSRLSSFSRTLKLAFSRNRAMILFGPRKVGKSTLIQSYFKNAFTIDLLKTDVRHDFELNPSILREKVLASKAKIFVIDEIQKVPPLLDEIHWCLENTKTKFVLCGSSARSLKRGTEGILGGRAWRFDLFPLTTHEIREYNLERILLHGLIPTHYLSKNPNRDLRAYISEYIEEEIRKETKVRNIPTFSRFTEIAGKLSTQLINYANVGRECGISPKTVREYYQILEDTLLGFRLTPWEYRKDRRLIETEKFYLFDCGVMRYLKRIEHIEPETDVYGALFESFMIQEIRAYHGYFEKLDSLTFWKTSTNFEVDLIIGEMKVAIEIKSSSKIQSRDLKGLRALMNEHTPKKKIIICREKQRRKTEDGIDILPWEEFCRLLWARQIF